MAILTLADLSDSDITTFWSRVDKRTPIECWLWTNGINRDGYGTMMVAGRNARATHISLALDSRPMPFPKAEACHRCDNPSCVNPAHLWWGTHQQNAQDAARKGRWSRPIHHRVTRHHINLMNCPDERLHIEARRWNVPLSHLEGLRAELRKRRPALGDPLNGLGHPGRPLIGRVA